MDIDLKVGDTTGMPTDYSGYTFNSSFCLTTLKFYLRKNHDGKNPKITYRK
jgi:hypothetical protein